MVGAGGAERNLDGTATDAAGLLGLSGLLTSRLLRLLGLLSFLGTGGERRVARATPRTSIRGSFMCSPFFFL